MKKKFLMLGLIGAMACSSVGVYAATKPQIKVPTQKTATVQANTQKNNSLYFDFNANNYELVKVAKLSVDGQ